MTTTHLIKSAPSVWILAKTIRSLRSHMNVMGCQHWVYYDAPAVLCDRHHRYLENLNQLGQEMRLRIIVRQQSGLKANYLDAVNSVQTPYMMFLEHDWKFKRAVDVAQLLDVFEQYPFVNIVRFNKYRNDSFKQWDHQSENEDRITEVPLTRTSAWSNNPHIVRLSKWRTDWLGLVQGESSHGSFGLEETLYWAYGRDIFNSTFKEAHAKWGSYLYGPLNEPPSVKHINGALSADRLTEPFFKLQRLCQRLVGRSTR